jgi:uncharacterized RDD family membrane protein YckC
MLRPMDQVGVVGACLQHPQLNGPACARCGTFRCAACLVGGRCPLCRDETRARPPRPEETVGFGRRLAARVLDLCFVQASGLFTGVMLFVVLAVLQGLGVVRAGWADRLNPGVVLSLLIGSVASLLGAGVTTWLCGASPGKLLLGLRTVRTDGVRPGFKASLLRELGFYVDSLFFGLVALGQMDDSPLKQRLGDQWAGTVVVHASTLPPPVSWPTSRVVLGVLLGLCAYNLTQIVFLVVVAR